MLLRCVLTLLLAGGVLLTPAQSRRRTGGQPSVKLDGKGGDVTSAKRRVGAQVKPGQAGTQVARPGDAPSKGVQATTAPKGTGLYDSAGDDTIKPGTAQGAKVGDGTSNTVTQPSAGAGGVNPARRAGRPPRTGRYR
jgi:hypothetical protein